MLEIHTVITFGYQIQDSAAIPREHNWVFGDRYSCHTPEYCQRSWNSIVVRVYQLVIDFEMLETLGPRCSHFAGPILS